MAISDLIQTTTKITLNSFRLVKSQIQEQIYYINKKSQQIKLRKLTTTETSLDGTRTQWPVIADPCISISCRPHNK